jgi:hypothetical protein
MSKSCLLVMLLASSVAFADKGDRKPKCPVASEAFEDRAKEVRKQPCVYTEETVDRCSPGIDMTIKLTEVAIEVCRADFAKVKADIAQYTTLAKRCETKFGKPKPTFDDTLDVVTCKLQVAKVFAVLNVEHKPAP